MPTPARVYRTEAVVLRRLDFGEADRILTLYTRDYGKLKVIAKGIRKPRSRKAGHLELFVQVDLLIARGRSLDIVTQAQMLNAFPALRTDLMRAAYAAHFVELVDALTEEGDENRSLYDLLVGGLRWLGETSDMRRTARYYELHILDLGGYRPQLFRCAVCGKEIKPQNQFYSPAEGGVLCPNCGPGRPHSRPLSLNSLKVLRYLQTRPFDLVEQLRLSQSTQAELERVLHDTLTYYLERRLKSAAFLKRLDRELRSTDR